MTGERAIRSVCVAGAGLVGLSGAIAFARALPGAEVTLLEVPEDPAALADRLTGTLPCVHRFHAAIGLDEADLVRSGAAMHRIGTRFEDWPAGAKPWYHVFGSHGAPSGGAAFHQLWARTRRAGAALPFHSYAPAAALAAAGRFVHPSDDAASPLSTYSYALRIEPERYREHLLGLVAKLPITRRAGELGGVEPRQDGGVAALRLKDGTTLAADLFLDCAGPSAPVHSAVSQDFESWTALMPFDRVNIGSGPPPASPTPCDTVTRDPGGWCWSSPLQDRTMAVRVSTGGDGVPLGAGWRPQGWAHNVLALGDAAVAIDPLHGTNLALAQSGILKALELLPGRDCHPLEIREYNRRRGQEVARVRDFIALHYLHGDAIPPESLAITLDQFEARGRLPVFEEETFDSDAWLGALIGLGIVPREINPVAASVAPEAAEEMMARVAARVAALPGQVPAYAAYLARMRG